MGAFPRVVLLGFDGATFDLLDRYAERGWMPAWAKLRRDGASGPLRSTVPPTTPPAWSSCVTGRNPGGHGVFDFRESPIADSRRPIVGSRSIRARTLWDLLGASGRRTCLLNFPMSWPPEPMCGVVVTGMLTPDGELDITWPAEEGEALRRAVPGYLPNVDVPRYDVDTPSSALRFLDDLDRSLRARIEAFDHFDKRGPWDLLFVTFVFHDRLGHLFWKLMQDGEGLETHPQRAVVRTRVEAMYRRFDAFLEARMAAVGGDLLLLCSDHGFGSTKWFFEVNTWLEEEGFLVLRPGAKLRASLFSAAMEAGDSGAGRRLVPSSLQGAVRERIRAGRSSFKDDLGGAIDWSRTRAFFPSVAAHGIHILRADQGYAAGARSDVDARRVRDLLADRLLALRGPDGDPVVDAAWGREEVYRGPYTHWAPDLVFQARGHSCVARPLLSARQVIRDARATPNGFHRTEGVVLAWGEGVDPGARLRGASIEDIAPTVLHALGEPVPDDLDGRVLDSLFSPGWRRRHPVRAIRAGRWTPPDPGQGGDPTGALAEGLKRLGYLG